MTDIASHTVDHPLAAPIPRPVEVVNGRDYTPTASGALMPVETIDAAVLLEDEVVRKICGFAIPLAGFVARFRAHTFDDVDSFIALLAQDHGSAKLRGVKGNMQLLSLDGLYKVQIAVAQLTDWGPQLQVAKSLIDECLAEWASSAPVELAAVVTDAFNVDQKGKVSTPRLLQLMRYDFKDPRWLEGVAAIRKSMRPAGSKRYVNCYRRKDTKSEWERIVIDVAAA